LGKYTNAIRTGEPDVVDANAAPVSAARITPGRNVSNAGSATQAPSPRKKRRRSKPDDCLANVADVFCGVIFGSWLRG